MSNRMEEVCFEDVVEFADTIMDRIFDSEDNLDITVVGKYNEIYEILRYIFNYDVSIEYINIESPNFSGYDDEYSLTISLDDGDIFIYCKQIRHDDAFSLVESDDIYVFGSCGSKAISHLITDNMYLVILNGVEDECECDEECDTNCPCGCHKEDDCIEYLKTNGNIHGFSASRTSDKGYYSYSFYTSDNLSKSDIHDMLKEFGL